MSSSEYKLEKEKEETAKQEKEEVETGHNAKLVDESKKSSGHKSSKAKSGSNNNNRKTKVTTTGKSTTTILAEIRAELDNEVKRNDLIGVISNQLAGYLRRPKTDNEKARIREFVEEHVIDNLD